MYRLVDGELEAQLVDPQARKQWLFLDRHPDFPGHWIVDGFSNEYLFDLGEIIGSYRALAPAGLQRFLEASEEHGYKIAFFNDPTAPLEEYSRLNAEPEVEIHSTFPNTVKGMLPYQVQGYNWLKDLDYGVARWDTGTGKTVLAASLINYHLLEDDFEICFFVVKKNNKVNTVRKLLKLAGITAAYVRGPKAQRERLYAEIRKYAGVRHSMGRSKIVVVLNYETFKNDFVHRVKKKRVVEEINSTEVPKEEKKADRGTLELTVWGEAFFPGRELLFIWDEMHTKLSNRDTELYRSICKCLYRTAPPQVNRDLLRPRTLRSYMLSATPIERNPEGWFNCIRLMDGGRTYGTVSDFYNVYVSEWNRYDDTRPEEFHNFERMRLKAASFVHQADKNDPDIAAVFPEAVEEVVYVDWDERNASVYNAIQDIAAGVLEAEGIANVPVFSLIGILQMICDAPEMVKDSAARREVFEDALETWHDSRVGRRSRPDGSEFALKLPEAVTDRLTNHNHPKLEKLREILLERHPDDQVVIYTRFNQTLMPYLEAYLQEWGISYGRYAGTERQQQTVQDAFQAGEIRVFLSSDTGSDSIDLDAGNIVIDYNLPWNWTTLTQRHNRVHRPTSAHETVYYYTLAMEGSVEERVLEIIERKYGYHKALFDPAAGDLSASARLTKDDLMYILTGQSGVL